MSDVPWHADHPLADSGSKEAEIINYDIEYAARFAAAKKEAETLGLKYEYPMRSGIGWKIHLAVSDDPQDPLTSQIGEYVKNKRFLFKIGKGGATEDGKGMTIYIGDRDTMEDFAGELHTSFGEEIPVQRGDALQSDMPIAGNVWARFENMSDPRNLVKIPDEFFGTVTEDKYIQYGPHGVPALRADAQERLWGDSKNKPTGQQIRERAVTALTQDYGAFFTGTRSHSV